MNAYSGFPWRAQQRREFYYTSYQNTLKLLIVATCKDDISTFQHACERQGGPKLSIKTEIKEAWRPLHRYINAICM